MERLEGPARPSRHIATRAIHVASGTSRSAGVAGGAPISFPIFQTSTFGFTTPEHAAEVASAIHPQDCYTRYGNPNFAVVEEALRDLEGAEAAQVTGSGMGAMSLVLLGTLRSGDHLVAQNTHYAATVALLRHWLPRFGVEVSFVDQTNPGAFESAICDRTRMILVETPVNPTLALTDLKEVAALARKRGIVTCADNTFATPVNQRPIELGIDLVVHSATKYLGGHSDVTGGVVVGGRDALRKLWEALICYGMVLHPFEAWLLARGIQTLPFRVERHNANALAVARFLESHPRVERVHYPGLPSHPQHELARRQMQGYGGVLSFEPAGGYEAARAFVGRLRLVHLAVSLGGTKSLAVHTASMIYAHVSAEERRAAGVSESLIRLAVGLEDVEDIVEDLDQALTG